MKSTVEQLSPTRVRINVEVPFVELQPDFARAYKQLAQQVRLPGFRPGKAPAKLLEARIGRGAVLEQVVNDAVPARYSEAVASSEVHPLGQPEIEITRIDDGNELVFTAEVDVRPEVVLPDLSALTVTVDSIVVGDDEVDTEMKSLRARFGTLTGVDRPAAIGDFVSIDLSATVDGEEVPDASTEGLSHEVGSDALVEGLDEAIVGLSAGESRVFATKLAGDDAEVTVKVGVVKERELPEPDDDFAQLASEFDTLEELEASLSEQVGRRKRLQQGQQIRDNALEALLAEVEVPLPESIVKTQMDGSVHDAIHELDHDEAKLDALLEAQGSSREQFDAEVRETAERAVKSQLVIDAVADNLGVQVGQEDIAERLMALSSEYGIEPQQMLGYLQQKEQLPALFADVRRGLTLAAVVAAVTVTDTDGNIVDTTELFGPARTAAEADPADPDSADPDQADPDSAEADPDEAAAPAVTAAQDA